MDFFLLDVDFVSTSNFLPICFSFFNKYKMIKKKKLVMHSDLDLALGYALVYFLSNMFLFEKWEWFIAYTWERKE